MNEHWKKTRYSLVTVKFVSNFRNFIPHLLFKKIFKELNLKSYHSKYFYAEILINSKLLVLLPHFCRESIYIISTCCNDCIFENKYIKLIKIYYFCAKKNCHGLSKFTFLITVINIRSFKLFSTVIFCYVG